MTGTKLSTGQLVALRRLVGYGPNGRAQFDLLTFLGRHPGGLYSLRALNPRTRCSRREIEVAVGDLVAQGVLQVHRHGAAEYYLFAASAAVRRAARAIGRLTPHERLRVLQQLCLPAATRDSADHYLLTPGKGADGRGASG